MSVVAGSDDQFGPTPFYRVRFVLRGRATVALPSTHAAVLYALLAEAAGRVAERAVPDGLLLDVPERSRVRIITGSRYAFGATVVAVTPAQARHVVATVVKGLSLIANDRTARGRLAGNFALDRVEDPRQRTGLR